MPKVPPPLPTKRHGQPPRHREPPKTAASRQFEMERKFLQQFETNGVKGVFSVTNKAIKLLSGQCFAMSCDWARVTLRFGGCRHKGMLTPGKWEIAQSSYAFQEPVSPPTSAKVQSVSWPDWKLFDNFDLEVTEHLLVQDSSPGGTAKKIGTLIPGVYIVGMSKPGDAHAMGYRHTSTLAEWFDPNVGLFRASSTGTLRLWLPGFLRRVGLADLSGGLDIFRVKLR